MTGFVYVAFVSFLPDIRSRFSVPKLFRKKIYGFSRQNKKPRHIFAVFVTLLSVYPSEFEEIRCFREGTDCCLRVFQIIDGSISVIDLVHTLQ